MNSEQGQGNCDTDINTNTGGITNNDNDNDNDINNNTTERSTTVDTKSDVDTGVPPEISTAYKEAQARGLPPGWTCSIDKRNRRKWTAPNNGRSCDSIPKAIAISVELGLLPNDTEIPSGANKKKPRIGQAPKVGRPRKRHKPNANTNANTNINTSSGARAVPAGVSQDDEAAAAASLLSICGHGSTTARASPPVADAIYRKQNTGNTNSEPNESSQESSSDDDEGPPPVPMDPEHTLNVYGLDQATPLPVSRKEASLPSTVHWDPINPNGSKIGWKVKIEHRSKESHNDWLDGRIVRYDPHTHKHKIEFFERNSTQNIDDDTNDNSSDDDDIDTATKKAKTATKASSQTTTMSKSKTTKNKKHCWIWLRNEQHNIQLATRMVWAHVKGYAWWPALVMESNSEASKTKEGYVLIEFFVTGEISCLRDTPESVRPFNPDAALDPIVAKHRKKRNQRAYQMALEEYMAIRATRNRAALYYARAAKHMASYYAPKNANGISSNNNTNNFMGTSGPGLIGQRVQVFRHEIDYPNGDTVVGMVRQYSPLQRKWLLSFELTKQNKKHPPAWINVYAKEHALKILSKTDPRQPHTADTNEDLIPFLFGLEPLRINNSKETTNRNTDHDEFTEILELLSTRCRGCVELLPPSKTTISASSGNTSTDLQPIVTCQVCQGSFHLSCVDPPWTLDTWQKARRQSIRGSDSTGADLITTFTCSRCTSCRGCFEKDITFGSHAHPSPPLSVSLPTLTSVDGGNTQVCSLDLCFMCKAHYDADRFCPNCAHVWDDKKFGLVRKQINNGLGGGGSNGRKRNGASSRNGNPIIEDSASRLVFGRFDGDENWSFSNGAVDPYLFHPETDKWGYTEDSMLACDSCKLWANAGCAMSEKEYDITSEGKHPIYSKEFLCRACCRRRCADIVKALQKEDRKGLFSLPVSEKVAPNYRDLIKEPMDLKSMQRKVETDEYANYSFLRELFEQMVFNALSYNNHFTDVWLEAKRFHRDALANVFAKMAKAAPASKYERRIQECLSKAEEARKKEEDRVRIDESVEKKDLVAGASVVVSITLPKLRESPPDLPSCVPFRVIKLKPLDAFFYSWMDCCFTCGSSGASDTFLFCVDCGEAFHSFCVSAPVHSMEPSSVAGWRCPNCKICEISGDVPVDETRMLFCEMCDRGFSLDLVDPPLAAAPTGLWVCGQCVDCKECDNKGDEKGVSLKYWSQNPEKCFRCGGCDGLDAQVSEGKCQVCSISFLANDNDAVQCNQCDSKVHASCDKRAEEQIQCKSAQRAGNESTPTNHNEYICPTCYKPTARAAHETVKDQDRIFLSNQAHEMAEAHPELLGEYSSDVWSQKVMEAVEWEIRNIWCEEYHSIIRDAIEIYCMAKTLGDPRFVIQQVLQRMHQLPAWLGHRALRFAVLVKRKEWDTKGFACDRIEVVVITAKLAAAFIDIACRTLGIAKEKVAFADRLEDMVKAPDDNGEVICPFDRVKVCMDAVVVDANGQIIEDDSSSQPCKKHQRRRDEAMRSTSRDHSKYKIAAPLCGWNSITDSSSIRTEWNDPRECCLCHLCGDDDAGFPDDRQPKYLGGMGRLLPMTDGLWVHTSCALWSSEVWEGPDDGLIHAVEKARGRGSQLKCFGCGFAGATVGCNKSNCPYNYHLPCARACGAVFLSNQQVFCANHKASETCILSKDSTELMKALLIAPEKQKAVEALACPDSDFCFRVGAAIVHSLGTIESSVDGFHSEDYITPPGFVASRIFWSARYPRSRTVYILKIERTPDGQTEFVIIPGDDPMAKIAGRKCAVVYNALMDRVRRVNADHFAKGDLFSKLPVVRKTRRKTYGLNGPQFFGYGLNTIRRLLEKCHGIEAVVAPLSPTSSPQYRFCFVYGQGGSDPKALVDSIRDMQRKRAAAKAENALQNSTGCARTEGMKAVVKSGGSGRITRALVRCVEDESGESGLVAVKKGEDKFTAGRNAFQVKYRQMKLTPIEQRLAARRSHIHGWGLFTKLDISKHDPVVEYMGEIIRQPIADKREKAYELSGEGSCFMFRLDMDRIIDATKIGCMARFMNHSCQPTAYAKVTSVDSDGGQEKKIVVFANRDIASGEEITLDYQFPVEDGSLRLLSFFATIHRTMMTAPATTTLFLATAAAAAAASWSLRSIGVKASAFLGRPTRTSQGRRVSTTTTTTRWSSSSHSSSSLNTLINERVSRLDTLQTLLQQRGAPGSIGCAAPWDLQPVSLSSLDESTGAPPFSNLHPYLYPLAQSKATGNVVCALRNPATNSDASPWPIVEAQIGGPGVHLVALNSEHLMRRIVCQVDFDDKNKSSNSTGSNFEESNSNSNDNIDLIALYNEGLLVTKPVTTSSTTVPPYVRGSVVQLGFGLEKYVLLQVGPFGDLYQQMARQHFARDDTASALIAAETANTKLLGFGSNFRFYARLLSSLPFRNEECRDAARTCLRLPLGLSTIGLTYTDIEEVARLGQLVSDEDDSLDAILIKLRDYYQRLHSVEDQTTTGNPSDTKTPEQVVLDKANRLINDSILTRQEWSTIRPPLAALFRSIGQDEMADFVDA